MDPFSTGKAKVDSGKTRYSRYTVGVLFPRSPKVMVIKREVAYGIVRGLSEFWNCEELQDFTVTIGKTKFGCHRFLLAACSGFFRALLRSGMKETQQNCATLEEISSETFQFILETFYTGRGILTNDNVIDIWRAASQLQVTFMISECEVFVLKSLSLDNYVQYFHYGRMLSSQIVTETVWNFILKHCNPFFQTSYFLELPFDDVLNLIKNQDLTTSTEDEVLKAVLKWVEYKHDKELQNEANCLQAAKENIRTLSSDIKPIEKSSDKKIEGLPESNTTEIDLIENTKDVEKVISSNSSVLCEKNVSCGENISCNKTGVCEDIPTESYNREQHLFELVSNTRTCLASHVCLEMLLNHPLVSENKQARDVLIRAILYQLQIGKRNGQWPTGATHRNKSEYENVAVKLTSDSKLMVYSLSKNNWSEYKFPPPNNQESIIRMLTVDKSLYSFCVKEDDDEDESPLLVYRLTDTNKWSTINISLKLKHITFAVVAVNECIYIVQMNKFWKLNPSLPTIVSLCDLPDEKPICHLISYDNTILAFYSVSTEGGADETAVLCFDISNNTWTRLNNLEGPADGMTSVKDDHSTYLLQSNGDLWKLVKPQSDVIDFEYILQLWRCDWLLHGAVNFINDLYIYGVKSETLQDDPELRKSVDGLFKKIIYLNSPESDSTRSMFVPFIAQKKLIVDQK